MTRQRVLGAVRATAIVLVACAALVGGTVVVARVVPDVEFPRDDLDVRRDEFTAVSVVTTRLERTASLQLEWSPSSAWRTGQDAAGVVTARWVEPDATVRCGDVVLSVDGHSVVAWCGASPMWRTLPATSSGSDRDDLNRLLTALGYLGEPTPSTSSLRSAITAFQADRGLVADGALDPADTIWIGGGPAVVIDEVALAVGDIVTGPTDVLVRAPHVAAARLTNAALPGEHSWEFVPLGQPDVHVPLHAHADVGDDELAALEASVPTTTPAGELPRDAAGVVQLAAAVEALAVPASALTFDAASSVYCVFDDDGAPVVVELLASEPSGTLVRANLHDGELIATIAPSERCSS